MSDDQARNSTIKEFCVRNRISNSTYFELRRRKKGPREMRVLGKVLISPEAETDWRRACETPDPSDQETIERLRERGRKGGRSSIARRSTERGSKRAAS